MSIVIFLEKPKRLQRFFTESPHVVRVDSEMQIQRCATQESFGLTLENPNLSNQHDYQDSQT